MYKSQSGSNAALAPWRQTRYDGPLTRKSSYKGFGRMQGLTGWRAWQSPKRQPCWVCSLAAPSSAAQQLPRLDWEKDGD